MTKLWKSELLTSISCVSHAFFGRKFREHDFATNFNCSKFIEDDPKTVSDNLDAAKNFLSAEKLITLHQVHENHCIVVDEKTESDLKADALVTKVTNIAIGILTADCTPVLLADPVAKIIGAAHAGWRGAAAGVIESAVEKMLRLGADPKNIFVCLGPAISMKNYEVSPDFKKNFAEHIKKSPDLKQCFCEIDGQLHFDIPEFCRRTLISCGILKQNIDRIYVDTYDHIREIFSYRYEREHSECRPGRFLSAIVIH